MNPPSVSAANHRPVSIRQPLIEVSPGELYDKITILEIKLVRMSQPEKRMNVQYELTRLRAAERSLPCSQDVVDLQERLRVVNETLWEVEDAIRECERGGDFGERFIALARQVYHRNDERAALKKLINLLLSSEIVEEKSYSSYRQNCG